MPEELRPAELHDVDRATCFAFLGAQHVGRLVLPGDEPFVAPFNYVVVGDALVLRTEADTHAALGVGQSILFEVDYIDDEYQAGWSVVIRGGLEDITDSPTVDADLRERLESWAPGPRDRWLRVTIDEMTGRWLRGADHTPPLDGRAYL